MTRTIEVNYLARVEGEGSLKITFDGDVPKDVEFGIFEPPRFFEALLRGRGYAEAPDITARICGICPVAYQMSACHALENLFSVRVSEHVRRLRRLLYAGEWVESHALHVFMLHAPDFLGYPDGIAMAKDHSDLVRTGLTIKKAGNRIMQVLGGREIHPVNVRVGGFFRLPPKEELAGLTGDLEGARAAMRGLLVDHLAHLTFADFERDYEFVALEHPDEYPMCEGRIASNKGLSIDPSEYDAHFEETQVARSNALHARRVGGGAYLTGPLARFNLNYDRLRPFARDAAQAVGLRPPCLNPFKSILVRSIEILQALDEALALIEDYDDSAAPSALIEPKAGTGHGCTEAPRGILYHQYQIDPDGNIEHAKIVPPTSQNQLSMEDDLRKVAPRLAKMPHDEATRLAEQAVRNYDPCISCATHFLKLEIER